MTPAQLSFAVLLFAIPVSAWCQCKETVDPTDRVADVKATLRCWKAELQSTKSELAGRHSEIQRLQDRLSTAEAHAAESVRLASERSRELERLRAEVTQLRLQLEQRLPDKPSAISQPQAATPRRTELVMGPGDSIRVSDNLTITAEPYDPRFGLALVVNGGRHKYLKPGRRVNLSKQSDPEMCYLEVMAIPQEKTSRGGQDIKIDYVCRRGE